MSLIRRLVLAPHALVAVVAALAALAALAVPAAAHADDKDTCATSAESEQLLQSQGKLVDARKQALLCARPTCPAVVKQDCEGWLASLELIVPSIVVATRDDDGRDIPGATVTLDGVAVDASNGRALPLDPGVHLLHVESAGRVPVDQKLIVREGERARPVIVTLSAGPASSRPPPTPAPAAAHGVSPFVYVMGTLAAVSLVGFTVFQIEAVSDATHFKHTCAPRCSQGDVDTVHTESTLGWVAGAATLAFAGGAVGLWVLGRGDGGSGARLDLGPARATLTARF